MVTFTFATNNTRLEYINNSHYCVTKWRTNASVPPSYFVKPPSTIKIGSINYRQKSCLLFNIYNLAMFICSTSTVIKKFTAGDFTAQISHTTVIRKKNLVNIYTSLGETSIDFQLHTKFPPTNNFWIDFHSIKWGISLKMQSSPYN